MSASFTGTAARLAGLAAQTLGWTPATFWAATPAELLIALTPPLVAQTPPSRAEIAALIERDRNG